MHWFDRPFRVAILGTLIALLFLCLTVYRNYGGSWTGLFCFGGNRPVPDSVIAHPYVFDKTDGYDGQMYYMVASDPFLQGDVRRYLDNARYRYRRGLVPLLAWALSGGVHDRLIPAYVTVILGFTALGLYWTSALFQERDHPAWWGLGYLLLPSTVIALDKMIVDVAVTTLAAGALWAWIHRRWTMLFPLLVLAALARDTGFFLAGAFALHWIWTRQWRLAAAALLTPLPALAWWLFVGRHTGPLPPFQQTNLYPLQAIATFLLHPNGPPPQVRFAWLWRVLEWASLATMTVFFCMAILETRISKPLTLFAAALSLFAFVWQVYDSWNDVYAYSRVFAPVILVMIWERGEQAAWLAALFVPRLALQMNGQILGILGVSTRHSP